MMSKRIVFFNHKGGVSKTTTAYNLGWKLAESSKVLLVDADPQCNLTSLLIEEFDDYYINEETKTRNIRDGVEVAFKGRPNPLSPIECYIPERNSNLYLIPGHQNLSEYEASLTFALTSSNAISALENLPGVFHAFIKLVEEKYGIDYTIIDLNPGLSSINQNLVMCSNYVVVPTNPDPFSLMALDTLASILPRWSSWLSQSGQLFSNSSYPPNLEPPKLLGSVIQRFNVRKGKAASPYRNNIQDIKIRFRDGLKPALARSNMVLPDDVYGNDFIQNGLCISEIPDFQGLLPKSLNAGVPVFALNDHEIDESGTVLDGMIANRDKFDVLFNEFADKVKALVVD
jgi:chromosome partitioning protein